MGLTAVSIHGARASVCSEKGGGVWSYRDLHGQRLGPEKSLPTVPYRMSFLCNWPHFSLWIFILVINAPSADH